MSCSTAFPRFDLSTLPEIPEGFVDSSWHDDVCPSYMSEDLGLQIFIDYVDVQDREYPRTARFSVCDLDLMAEGRTELNSDDWSEILAFVDTRRKSS